MSFSSIVKNELCRVELRNNCCLLAELAAVFAVSGAITASGSEANIRIVTENAAFARRLYSHIKESFKVNPEITIRKSKKLKKHTSYILVITSSMGAGEIVGKLGISFENGGKPDFSRYSDFLKRALRKPCCKKSYLRGAFFAGGSISDPEKAYHLEITGHNSLLSGELNGLMKGYGLNGKIIRRKGNFVLYLKEGENIVDFLNIIGAHSALLELENIRILKDMRNSVNRIVNCETANLEKTINASVRQIENIKYIRDNIGFDNLPANLREVAEMRLTFSDANLKELGEMLNPPLGKSGVNHRLRRLDQIAEHERESKGEL